LNDTDNLKDETRNSINWTADEIFSILKFTELTNLKILSGCSLAVLATAIAWNRKKYNVHQKMPN
jgi:hypothetical protein